MYKEEHAAQLQRPAGLCCSLPVTVPRNPAGSQPLQWPPADPLPHTGPASTQLQLTESGKEFHFLKFVRVLAPPHAIHFTVKTKQREPQAISQEDLQCKHEKPSANSFLEGSFKPEAPAGLTDAVLPSAQADVFPGITSL